MSASNNNQVAKDILAAATLYDVLGVPHNIDSSSSVLRRAYLSQSVKVHPDKNSDPLATSAFQRVAEAWTTLSDETSRREYDQSLRQPKRSSSGYNRQQQQRRSGNSGYYQEETYYAGGGGGGGGVSFQEAMYLFASVASSLSGSRAGGDFAQTLFWAQKLAEEYQQHQQQQESQQYQQQQQARGGMGRDYNNNNDFDNNINTSSNSTGTNTATAAMALGSGLRVVAGTSRFLGFKKSARAMENAATAAEVAAVSAVVADKAKEVPFVAKAFDKAQGSMRNMASNPKVQQAAKDAAQNPQVQSAFRQGLKFAGEFLQAQAQAQAEQQQAQAQQQQRHSQPNYYR